MSVDPEYHQQIPEDSDNRLRILVVEDDEDMRQYIVSKLSKTYNVQEAPEGKSAIHIAREQMPDLIISDIILYGQTISFLRHIRTSRLLY